MVYWAQEIYFNATKYRENRIQYSGRIYLLIKYPYLSYGEKLEVEMWYQLPGDIMLWAYVITAVYSVYNPLRWEWIIGIPLLANLTVGIWNWYLYKRDLVYKLYLTFLHGWIIHLIGIGTAAFLLFKGAIVLAIISFIVPFGLLSFVEPHMWLYTFLAQKYRMHPKYAFFKKEYRRIFPFEQHKQLEERAKRGERMAWPRFFDVDDTLVIIDSEGDEVFGKTSTGFPYPPAKALAEGLEISEEEFNRGAKASSASVKERAHKTAEALARGIRESKD